jgi:hypothetical protein
MQVITMEMIGATGLDCKTYFITDKDGTYYVEWDNLSDELQNMVVGALSNGLDYIDYRCELYGNKLKSLSMLQLSWD